MIRTIQIISFVEFDFNYFRIMNVIISMYLVTLKGDVLFLSVFFIILTIIKIYIYMYSVIILHYFTNI